jgi:uncharacterized membrane protein YedE/YeeE
MDQLAQTKAENTGAPRAYWNPYVAGVALGLVLLGALVVFGRGLGASGALTRITALGLHSIFPRWVTSNAHLGAYFAPGAHWWDDWLVFELVGVALGGLAAAITAGRLVVGIDKGPRITGRTRILFALLGGTIVGFGARLAQGCTSGQALTGGATMALGSWAFMFSVFGGAYALAWFLRRLWT